MIAFAARGERSPDRVPFAAIAPRREVNPETKRLEGEHAVIVGITGFGKTFLVRRFTFMRTFVSFHDPKGTFRDPRFKRFDRLDRLMRADPRRYPKVIYAPNRRELRDRGAINAYCEWIYINGNRMAIFDEATSIATKSGDLPDGYIDSLSRGREMGIEVVTLTQQPVFVANIVFTQSRNFYIFFTNLLAHQQKIASLLPISIDAIRALRKKQFYYYREGELSARGPMRLEG